jgi:hypothetical protein
MRRHSSLAVTSAIVLIGGAGVLGDGALSLRASAITNHLQPVRSTPHALRKAKVGKAAIRPSGLLRPNLARNRPFADLLVADPAVLGRTDAVRRRFVRSRAVATSAKWLALRNCESGDDYADDTGNGYYGAYQFALGTWWSLGYSGLPNEAPAAVQDRAAVRLQHVSGWSAWPVCSAEVGL